MIKYDEIITFQDNLENVYTTLFKLPCDEAETDV